MTKNLFDLMSSYGLTSEEFKERKKTSEGEEQIEDQIIRSYRHKGWVKASDIAVFKESQRIPEHAIKKAIETAFRRDARVIQK